MRDFEDERVFWHSLHDNADTEIVVEGEEAAHQYPPLTLPKPSLGGHE